MKVKDFKNYIPCMRCDSRMAEKTMGVCNECLTELRSCHVEANKEAIVQIDREVEAIMERQGYPAGQRSVYYGTDPLPAAEREVQKVRAEAAAKSRRDVRQRVSR